MYSHVFAFTFDESVPLAERMRFLSDLFLIPEQVGASASDIYWCKVGYEGAVEFYSNSP